MPYKVVFLIDGTPHEVEFDPALMPYAKAGLRGSLLDVALNFHIPLEHVCGGHVACTTCHVIVHEGMEHLSEMSDEELDRLDTAWEVTPRSRLGCQAVVRGDVVCELPRYTRNYVNEAGAIDLGKDAASKDRGAR